MIKVVFCLRRLPSLTIEEFRRYWLDQHAPLVRTHAEALRIRRYTQSHTVDEPRFEPAVRARGGDGTTYDGVAELWWASLDDMSAAQDTAAGRHAARLLLQDERRFIDLPRSVIFLAQEHVVVADRTGSTSGT